MASLSTEKKFVAPGHRAADALSLAAHFCLPDPEHPFGSIASVYYDTPRLEAYGDKDDGHHLKKKVRVRWYAEHQTGKSDPPCTAFLECKHRLGSARFKLRTTFTSRADPIHRAPLHDPFFSTLLTDNIDAMDDPLPLDLVPVICIRYVRHRFVCPRTGTRVAIDSGIHSDRVNRDLLPNVHPPRLNVAVCEFKNDQGEALSWIRHLHACGFRLQSFSKYGECIAQALNGGT